MKPLIAIESVKPELRGRMAVVCAWCGFVKEKGDPSLIPSHGICDTCFETVTKEENEGPGIKAVPDVIDGVIAGMEKP